MGALKATITEMGRNMRILEAMAERMATSRSQRARHDDTVPLISRLVLAGEGRASLIEDLLRAYVKDLSGDDASRECQVDGVT